MRVLWGMVGDEKVEGGRGRRDGRERLEGIAIKGGEGRRKIGV